MPATEDEPRGAAPLRSTDEREVVALFEQFYRAICEQRVAANGAALWASDVDVAMLGSERGEVAVGPDAVRRLLDAVATSPRQIAFAWDEHRVHVEGDVAWLTASGTATVDKRDSLYRTTAIFVRRGGRWSWHTYSGSEPR